MEKLRPEKSEKPEQTSPLAVAPLKVARINRRTIVIVVAVISVVVAYITVTGLSSKKKPTGKEAAAASERDQNRTIPRLPDRMDAAPGKYDDIPGGRSSSLSTKRNRAAAASSPGVASGGQQPSSVDTNRPIGPPMDATERDQSQKDAASAINSPVTFGQNLAPQQAGEEESRPALVIPPLQAAVQPFDRLSAGDDQNMQGEKREFSRERGVKLPYVKTTLMPPISRFEIKAGTILPATLVTGINSDLPGQIVAQIRENVYDTVTGNYLLIPQGTRLIGEYDSNVAFGQERVLVVWTRLIMPDGNSIWLEGMPGIDLSGYAGVTGAVNNHYGKLVTGVVLGSVIGAGAQVAVGGQGAPNVPPSFGQLAVSGAAQNINQTAQQHTNKVLNMQPTIEVSPGDKINVFVTKDMILKPFTE